MNKEKNNKISSANLIPRPPIVVVMGHIDHGKTTLLDYIRKTNVAEKETGGITQHVSAYEIEHQSKRITFIDTPGHEAFSKMRSRGARIADLAILVIAADDGVKAQTVEAISAIKEAKIPFIVAINKTDKESANVERVKNELAKNEVYLEGMGGKIPCANISAKTGQGIPELLELVLLTAEMEELKADKNCPASGIVIESHLDQKRGIAATLIIQNGTLKKKMFINAGDAIAPVKIFESFSGKPLEEAMFSAPVKLIGFDKMPEAGAEFKTYETRGEAEFIGRSGRRQRAEVRPPPIPPQIPNEQKTAMPIIIKADVSGSLEALEKEILKLSTADVGINILRLGIGNINEDDIKLASTGKNPVIIGFRVKTESNLGQIAGKMNVSIIFFDIIYKLSEWLEEEIKKRTPISIIEENIGTGEIIRIFLKEKSKQVVGGKVLKGKIMTGKYVKISRRGTQIAQGKIMELQHNKIKMPEVEEGKEFGAMMDIKNELAKGDLIEIYDIKENRKV